MRFLRLVFWAAALGLLSSCGVLFRKKAPPAPERITAETRPPGFTVDEGVYAALSPRRSRVEISREELKLRLLDGQGRVALETDCSTGMEGKRTPAGTFPVKEKIVDKRSNKYGSYVDKETGETVVKHSWTVERRPPGTRFLGTPMPYWMRLTWAGVGIHVGKFPRGYHSSFGCIRVPEEAQKLLYAKCRVGTRVRIE